MVLVLLLLTILIALIIRSSFSGKNFRDNFQLSSLNNASFDFISKGTDGDRGEDGRPGTDGDPGPSGPAGKDGLPGKSVFDIWKNLLPDPENSRKTSTNSTDMMNNIRENIFMDIFPNNTIIAWKGELNDIPEGWFLCDGREYTITYSNNTPEPETFTTPDLRGKFILGYGGSDIENGKELGDTGGAYTVTLEKNQIPRHSHNVNMKWKWFRGVSLCYHSCGGANSGQKGKWKYAWKSDPRGYWKQHYHPGPAPSGVGADTSGQYKAADPSIPFEEEDINVQENVVGPEIAGTTQAGTTEAGHENMPPYKTLAYIIKHNLKGVVIEITPQIGN